MNNSIKDEPPMRAVGHNVLFINLLILVLYTLFVWLPDLLPFLLYLFFLTYLLPYLTFSFENRPAFFPCQRSLEVTKPGLLGCFSLF